MQTNRQFLPAGLSLIIRIGRLTLLPVLPKCIVSGLRARGAIIINQLAWDMTAETSQAVLVSDSDQTLALTMGRDLEVTYITVNGKPAPVIAQWVKNEAVKLVLPSLGRLKSS
jgi:hypothetical protein